MKKLGLGLLLAFTSTLFGIETMDSMDQVRAFVEDANNQTLVAWDVDMVLIHPKAPVFQMNTMIQHKEVFRKIFTPLNPHEQAIALSLITLNDAQLLEPEVCDLLKNLQTRGIPHIALTGCLTGSLGSCPSMERHRLATLAKLGIHFIQGAPLQESFSFDELPYYRGYPVMYEEGVIFANGLKAPKGEALVAFLKRCKRCPQKIIFIDDRLPYLEDVEARLKDFDEAIEYQGIHYTGAKQIQSPPVTEEAFQEAWSALAEQARAIYLSS